MNRRFPAPHIFLALLVACLIFLAGQLGLLATTIHFAQKLTHATRSGLVATLQDLRPDRLAESRTQQQVQNPSLLAQIAKLEQENATMRRLLSAPLPSAWKFLPARVVGLGDNLLIIDEGSQSQVATGMTVIVADTTRPGRSGILVGQIATVSPGQSQVLLPTHADVRFPVQILSPQTGATRGKGLATGTGGKVLIQEILNSEQVAAGDLIVTTPGKLAPDLLVGILDNPVADPTGVYKSAPTIPFLDPYRLDYVTIITSF